MLRLIGFGSKLMGTLSGQDYQDGDELCQNAAAFPLACRVSPADATPFLLFPTPLPLLTSLVLLFPGVGRARQWRETGQPFPRTPLTVIHILLVWASC